MHVAPPSRLLAAAAGLFAPVPRRVETDADRRVAAFSKVANPDRGARWNAPGSGPPHGGRPPGRSLSGGPRRIVGSLRGTGPDGRSRWHPASANAAAASEADPPPPVPAPPVPLTPPKLLVTIRPPSPTHGEGAAPAPSPANTAAPAVAGRRHPSPSRRRRQQQTMDDFLQRQLARRELVRRSLLGAGAVGLGMTAAGRRFSSAVAQDPAAGTFDPAACYQAFPGAEPVQYDAAGEGGFNIGLSNSYIGNVWRTQMIKMAQAYSELPEIAPLVSELQVNTSDRDDAAQIAAIENMISNGAQAIVIIANTPTALVQTVQQARADGIVIVSFDSVVQTDPPDPSLDLGVTVNEDQVEMGRRWAQFLVDETGGQGKILMVNGVAGTGVDTERRRGAAEVFGANPGITTVEVVGNWDPGTAQTATATALSANPDIAGVWCQGGTDGAVRAFLDAGRPLVPFAGEAENGFRKQMLQFADQMPAYSIGQSPGLVAVSIRAAISLLQGQPVPRAVSVPLPEARTADLQPGVNVFPDGPDNFFTPIQIPACGVNLTFEEVDRQQV